MTKLAPIKSCMECPFFAPVCKLMGKPSNHPQQYYCRELDRQFYYINALHPPEIFNDCPLLDFSDFQRGKR